MKKYMIPLSLVLLLSSVAPLAAKAVSPKTDVPTSVPTTAQLPQTKETIVLLNRLETIQGMDIGTMKASEKRVLRKEVKSIQNRLRAIEGGGIYISVGSILIILLLILLFA